MNDPLDTIAAKTAKDISDYLVLGMHHLTNEGQSHIAAIIRGALAEARFMREEDRDEGY